MAAPLSEIIAIVRDLLHDTTLDLASTTRFDDLPNWDSMDLITLVVEIERRYDLQFSPPDIDHLVKLGDLVDSIQSRQAPALSLPG